MNCTSYLLSVCGDLGMTLLAAHWFRECIIPSSKLCTLPTSQCGDTNAICFKNETPKNWMLCQVILLFRTNHDNHDQAPLAIDFILFHGSLWIAVIQLNYSAPFWRFDIRNRMYYLYACEIVCLSKQVVIGYIYIYICLKFRKSNISVNVLRFHYQLSKN